MTGRVGERWRPAWADIDLDAVRHNASLLAGLAGPAALCAVVKADGYGHGAGPVARAALEGGATWLAVALVEEGVPCARRASRRRSSCSPSRRWRPWPRRWPAGWSPPSTPPGASGALARRPETGRPALDVHLKVDTGMHRVGADPADAPGLAATIAADPQLDARRGLDPPGGGRRAATRSTASSPPPNSNGSTPPWPPWPRAGHRPPLTHAANSAGAIAVPPARRDLVRCGIAVYGVAPTPALADQLAAATGGERLRPVLSLRTQVT